MQREKKIEIVSKEIGVRRNVKQKSHKFGQRQTASLPRISLSRMCLCAQAVALYIHRSDWRADW